MATAILFPSNKNWCEIEMILSKFFGFKIVKNLTKKFFILEKKSGTKDKKNVVGKQKISLYFSKT